MSKEKFDCSKPHVNIGTIGHTDNNKATLSEVIEGWFELLKQSDIQIEDKKIRDEEYLSCNHIYISLNNDFNICMKCGLVKSFVLPPDYCDGIYTNILCDIELARAIYSKIKEAHPDIDDETATKYFKVALFDIRNIVVNKDREKSRAKRLSLNPKFNRWNIN